VLCLLYAAGFNFTLSLVVLDCLYDARLLHLFFGEKMSMPASLFTNGYNLFHRVCLWRWLAVVGTVAGMVGRNMVRISLRESSLRQCLRIIGFMQFDWV